MKKLIVTAIAIASAASVFAQGTIVFNNYVTGTHFRIYAPAATATGFSQMGNATSDTPAGTTSWAGFNLVGYAGGGNTYLGATTFAQLLMAPGTGQSEASLQPAATGGITTFRTASVNTSSGAAGLIVAATPTFDAFTAANYTGGGTLEMVVWDASVVKAGYDLTAWGTVGSKGAEDAWLAGLIAGGKSGLINLTATMGNFGGPPVSLPPSLPTTMQSFNMYYQVVPEPSTFALAGLGAAALLIFRRRK